METLGSITLNDEIAHDLYSELAVNEGPNVCEYKRFLKNVNSKILGDCLSDLKMNRKSRKYEWNKESDRNKYGIECKEFNASMSFDMYFKPRSGSKISENRIHSIA